MSAVVTAFAALCSETAGFGPLGVVPVGKF